MFKYFMMKMAVLLFLVPIAMGAEAKPKRNIQVIHYMVQQDVRVIEKYVKKTVYNDMQKAKLAGKWLATCFVSPEVYDSMPFEFFTSAASISQAFAQLFENGDAAIYIQTAKEEYKKRYGDFDNTNLSKFLFSRIIDNLTISHNKKEEIRKNPIRMDQCVRRGEVKREEYMYYTLLNFAVRFYLQKEFGLL